MELRFIFITNNPELASFAEACGVTRFMVDLESIGKIERQGHLNTLISNHSVDDIKKIRDALISGELIVRINPLHFNTHLEIEAVIAAGADVIMQPMIQSVQDVEQVGRFINKRVKLLPLIETCTSLECCTAISELDCVSEIHFGLNDLHLEMGLSFMFDLYRNGVVSAAVDQIRKPFGIGGVARCDDGLVSGRYVISEHANLGSTGVILSRSFHGEARSVAELKNHIDLKAEITALTNVYYDSLRCSPEVRSRIRSEFFARIAEVSAAK